MKDARLVIDCARCIMAHSPHCADCLVTHLCHDPADGPVVLAAVEVRSLRVLQDAGLVPRLRHRTSGQPPVEVPA